MWSQHFWLVEPHPKPPEPYPRCLHQHRLIAQERLHTKLCNNLSQQATDTYKALGRIVLREMLMPLATAHARAPHRDDD